MKKTKIWKLIRIGKIMIGWIYSCCWCSVEGSVTEMKAEACNIGRRNILDIKRIIEE